MKLKIGMILVLLDGRLPTLRPAGERGRERHAPRAIAVPCPSRWLLKSASAPTLVVHATMPRTMPMKLKIGMALVVLDRRLPTLRPADERGRERHAPRAIAVLCPSRWLLKSASAPTLVVHATMPRTMPMKLKIGMALVVLDGRLPTLRPADERGRERHAPRAIAVLCPSRWPLRSASAPTLLVHATMPRTMPMKLKIGMALVVMD